MIILSCVCGITFDTHHHHHHHQHHQHHHHPHHHHHHHHHHQHHQHHHHPHHHHRHHHHPHHRHHLHHRHQHHHRHHQRLLYQHHIRKEKPNLSHDSVKPPHVPYWLVNDPTLWDVCVSMIGRADIEGTSNVACPASLPQASCACGKCCDTSSCSVARLAFQLDAIAKYLNKVLASQRKLKCLTTV